MPYTPQTWSDGSTGGTPITAARLSHIESGISAVDATASTSVQSVTAGDGTITVAGTATAPTVAVGAIPESKVTNLTADLAAKTPTSRQLLAGTGLTGGGDLTVDRTLTVAYGTTAGTAAVGNDTRITGAAQTTGATFTGEVDFTSRIKVGGYQLPMLAPATRRPPWRMASYIQNFQTGHGFTANGTGVGSSNMNDTSTFIRGTQCATVTTAGNGVQSGITKNNVGTFDMTGKMLRLTFKVDSTAHLNYIAFYLGTGGLANYYFWQIHSHDNTAGNMNFVQNGEWVTMTVSWANVQSTGGTFTISSTGVPSTKTGLTDMRFAVYDDNTANAVTYHLQSIEIIPDTTGTFPSGVVSITFDDSYQNVYDLGRPILDSYGYRPTLYTIQDVIGTASYQTMTELKNLQVNSGWEVAGHAYTVANHNAGYNTLTAQQVTDELSNLKAWQVSNGFHSDNFAYPHGWYGNTADGVPVDQIVSRFYNTGRSILSELAESWTPAMQYRLRAKSGVSSVGTPVSSLTAAGGPLDRCQLDGSWYIICLHQIVTTTPADSTQLLQSDLSTLLSAINSRGIPVLPIGDVLKFYQ
jgi:hypothetical protein